MKLAWLLVLAPVVAHAGGVAYPGRGVRALSVGGAFVAGAEDGNALWYNPARLKDTGLTLELSAVFLNATFSDPTGNSVSNEATPLANPTLGFIWSINDHFAVGVGAYAPYSAQHAFNEAGPQRYSLVRSDATTQLILAVGASAHFGPLRVGASFQNVMSHLRQRTVLSGYTGLFGQPDDPELDILTELDLKDDFTPTGNFGGSFDLGPVTLGLAVQLPFSVAGDAKFRVRLGSSVFFDPITVEGDTVAFEVPFPLMVRGGARWQINPRWMVEAAINWEGWSVQDKLVLDPQGRIILRNVPGIGDYQMRPLEVDRRMKDTLSFHLGSDFEVFPDLHARAGAYFENSSFPDETFTVAQLDDSKLGIALGASYSLNHFRIDLAASRVFQGTRTITNSEQRQVNPTNPEQALVIGNGTHRSNLWIAGLGVTWRL